MIWVMLLVFVLGYVCIAMEHKLHVDKAAIALLMCGALWTVFMLWNTGVDTLAPPISKQLLDFLGDASEILFFLIGAMTIVNLVDRNGGFNVITDHIKTRNKRKLLWLVSIMTFFLSAILDNMTTAIVMIMLLRRIVPNYKERWVFAGIIIIAANGGGAFSPIGDVTTVMLWVRGNVTSLPLLGHLFLPSIVSTLVPTALATRFLPNNNVPERWNSKKYADKPSKENFVISSRMSKIVLIAGVCGLLFVPLFKSITGLPPYLGMLISLSVLWIWLELVYEKQKGLSKNRVSSVLEMLDMPTILFFLGVLMSVSALQSAGVLQSFADFLNKHVHEVYTITSITGALAAILGNVPLVAAFMGMYPVADGAMVTAAADPAYMSMFVQDGLFWHLLAYCAGVGGSILIIGSAAGVVAMGLEKINFSWYLKRISLLALSGYGAGMAVIFLQNLLF